MVSRFPVLAACRQSHPSTHAQIARSHEPMKLTSGNAQIPSGFLFGTPWFGGLRSHHQVSCLMCLTSRQRPLVGSAHCDFWGAFTALTHSLHNSGIARPSIAASRCLMMSFCLVHEASSTGLGLGPIRGWPSDKLLGTTCSLLGNRRVGRGFPRPAIAARSVSSRTAPSAPSRSALRLRALATSEVSRQCWEPAD